MLDYIKNFYKEIIFVSLISLIFIMVLIGFNIKISKDISENTIYENIYINGISVAGLTKDEASLMLSQKIFDGKNLNLFYNDDIYTFNFKDFNVEYSIEEAVNQAFNFGRSGTKFQNFRSIRSLKLSPVYIYAEKTFDEAVVEEKIRLLADLLYVEPKNATIVKSGGEFTVVNEVFGIKLDFDKVYHQVLDIIRNADYGDIYLNFENVAASYGSEVFNGFGDLLGSFQTSFTRTNSNKGRITNIEVASGKVNGVVLYPDEVFSTHENLGNTTAENGYKPAPTIINGSLVDDYGGGICQVSSTLYNAVLLAELDILERKNHSLKVSYLDYGFDATIAGDYIDFKFKNSYDVPIYIESYVTENSIVCNIYGVETRNIARSIKFESSLVQVIEPDEPNITYTSSLEKGVIRTKVYAQKGYKYKLYKLVYEDGILQEKILINDSYYKPRTAEILVGTKE